MEVHVLTESAAPGCHPGEPIAIENEPGSTAQLSPNRNYQCSVCGKRFGRLYGKAPQTPSDPSSSLLQIYTSSTCPNSRRESISSSATEDSLSHLSKVRLAIAVAYWQSIGTRLLIVPSYYRSKVRCSGEYPQCSPCIRRGVPCSYGDDTLSPQRDESAETPGNDVTSNDSIVGTALQSWNVAQKAPALAQDSVTSSTGSYVFPEGFHDFYASDLFAASEMNSFVDLGFPDYNTMLNLNTWPNALWLLSNESPALPIDNMAASHIPAMEAMEAAQLSLDDSLHKHMPVSDRGRSLDEEDQYPMQWLVTQPKCLTLAPLGPSKSSSAFSGYFSLPRISSHATVVLEDILKAPYERPVWPLVSIPSFPPGENLDRCVDLYFAHFDKVYSSMAAAPFHHLADILHSGCQSSIGHHSTPPKNRYLPWL